MNHFLKKVLTVFYFAFACLLTSVANLAYSASLQGAAILQTAAGPIDFGFIDYIEKIPGLIHHLSGQPVEGDAFTLDNQSKWIASDIEVIKNWKKEDDLYITQNQALLSAHRFALVNPRLQKAVPISLLREPLPHKTNTFFLSKIDLTNNDVVTLHDGREYSVLHNDHGTLRRIGENDRIMIGFNSSDRLDDANPIYHKNYLLIDTSHNTYVRVSPVARK